MCPLIFGLSELLEIFLPVAQVISQTLFKGLLVGPLSKAGLRTMCHVHVISYFRLPAKHSVFSILGGLIVFFYAGRTLVLSFFLCGILGLVLLSESSTTLWLVSILFWEAAISLLYLAYKV